MCVGGEDLGTYAYLTSLKPSQVFVALKPTDLYLKHSPK